MEDLADLKPDFEKMGRKAEKFFESEKFQKYLPELEAWGQSEAVKAKQAHDEKIANSKFGKALWSSLQKVGEDA